MSSNWYLIKIIPGMEKIVKTNMERTLKSKGLQDFVSQIEVYQEGYLLINMIFSDEVWYIVRNTPMVIGFLGDENKGSKPYIIPENEVKMFLNRK